MINETNMRLWVEALRSGQFTQGREMLRAEGSLGPKYCCLGVACEVAIANGVKLETRKVTRFLEVGTSYDDNVEFLPTAVVEWLGLENRGFSSRAYNPTLQALPGHLGSSDYSCTGANDEARFTLADIADMIEHTFLKGGPA